ncbi:MAG: peptide chain release factor N(5)-glutamine methyltransferase [Gemmatimonadota bacterium]|nr:peptide chain release factor N(5)-glutamine methyltransferase [Gemmatimonadota bacterium]
MKTDGRLGGWLGGRAPEGQGDGATVADLLASAARTLGAAGIEDAPREARELWAAVADTSVGEAWHRRAQAPPAAFAARYRAAVARRTGGVPAAYAAGTAAFRQLELLVDERVLIPRPETEGLVEHVLAFARLHGRWGVAADIGTGSGCIALALATEGAFRRVIGTDISEAALAVAGANAARVGADAVEFRAGDLLGPLGGERVDVVVSNPPYVTAAEWDALDPGVRGHEPRLALVSGTDGLRHTTVVLRQALRCVLPGGLLALELDCRRAGAALALARAVGWTTARVEQDLCGRPRYLLATKEAER